MSGPTDERALSDYRLRIRGIYTTALTKLALAGDATVVQASPPIQDRFDTEFPEVPEDARIETTADRQGISITGNPAAVSEVRAAVSGVGRDVLAWPDPAPNGAVVDGTVDRTRGGGAIVELPAGREGYLPFDAVDEYIDVGDQVRVQVRSPQPPWTDEKPVLGADIEVDGGLLWLRRGKEGVSAVVDGDDATELVRSTELLDPEPPDGWEVRWKHAATEAGLDAMGEALAAAIEQAAELDDAIASTDGTTNTGDETSNSMDDRESVGGESSDDTDTTAENANRATDAPDHPVAVATPMATAWCWFGHEARFALDEWRRGVTPTMRGHHRIKAGSSAASSAVDLVEGVCPDAAETFPADAVLDTFGPVVGDEVAIKHGKPDGQLFSLGQGEVTAVDRQEGQITVHREMQSKGTYDALGTERTPGDVAITKLKEGRWWYPTIYRDGDGESKGTYVNVCTPVELFPDSARYVDLHVDVVKRPDGTVERVDEDELEAAVEAGDVPDDLAEKARSVAAAVERALS